MYATGNRGGPSSQEKEQLFGHIDGYPVGSRFETRRKCYEAGVHRSLRAGIVGNIQDGAYSVVLSKGYPDDKDEGNIVYYTGSGGRNYDDAKEDWFAPQTADQEFTRQNRALQKSQETQKPIRLIRGHEGNPFWSPIYGYRYDGLYKVVEAWQETGSSGYLICKYKFVREPNQDSLPKRSVQIFKQKQPKKSKNAFAPVKLDTSRAGIRVRERDEERRRKDADMAAQKARMRLKRNASALSETDESAKSPQRPSKRVIPTQAREQTSSPPTRPTTIPVPKPTSPGQRPLWTPKKKNVLEELGLGRLNTQLMVQSMKRARQDLSSPISPVAPATILASSDTEEGYPGDDRQLKRIRPSLSESLQEKMERLSLPGPSSHARQ